MEKIYGIVPANVCIIVRVYGSVARSYPFFPASQARKFGPFITFWKKRFGIKLS